MGTVGGNVFYNGGDAPQGTLRVAAHVSYPSDDPPAAFVEIEDPAFPGQAYELSVPLGSYRIVAKLGELIGVTPAPVDLDPEQRDARRINVELR